MRGRSKCAARLQDRDPRYVGHFEQFVVAQPTDGAVFAIGLEHALAERGLMKALTLPLLCRGPERQHLSGFQLLNDRSQLPSPGLERPTLFSIVAVAVVNTCNSCARFDVVQHR